jgi:hypothetical protein
MTSSEAKSEKKAENWSFQQLVNAVKTAESKDAMFSAIHLHSEAVPSPSETATMRYQFYQRLCTAKPSEAVPFTWASRMAAVKPSLPPRRFRVSVEIFAPYRLCNDHLLQTLLERKSRCMPGVHAVVPREAAGPLVRLLDLCDVQTDTALWIYAVQTSVSIPLPVRIVSPEVAEKPQFDKYNRRLPSNTAMTLELVTTLSASDYSVALEKALRAQETEIEQWSSDVSVVACGACFPNPVRYAYAEHKASYGFYLPRNLWLPDGVGRLESYLDPDTMQRMYAIHSWREFLQVLYAKASETADTATLFLRKTFCSEETGQFDRKALEEWMQSTWDTYLKEDGWTFSPIRREVEVRMMIAGAVQNLCRLCNMQ